MRPNSKAILRLALPGLLLLIAGGVQAQSSQPKRPAAQAASVNALPMGRWDCRDEIAGPLRLMGYFTLSKDGTYRYLDKPSGRYRYDAATGMIEFLTGPYAKDASGDFFRAFYALNSAGRPMITLRLVSTNVAYADADYCFPRS